MFAMIGVMLSSNIQFFYVPMHSACDHSLPTQSSFAVMMAVIFEGMQGTPCSDLTVTTIILSQVEFVVTKCTLQEIWTHGAEQPVTNICSVT